MLIAPVRESLLKVFLVSYAALAFPVGAEQTEFQATVRGMSPVRLKQTGTVPPA